LVSFSVDGIFEKSLPPIDRLPEMDPCPRFRRRMPAWALSGALYEIPFARPGGFPFGKFSWRLAKISRMAGAFALRGGSVAS